MSRSRLILVAFFTITFAIAATAFRGAITPASRVGSVTPVALMLDPRSGSGGTFTEMGGLVAARCKHKAGQLPSGQLLVAGGSKEVEIFDRASGKFLVARGQMSDRWHFMTETRLRDGSVPLAGAAIQIAIRPRRRPGFTGSDLSAMICQP